MQIHCPTCRKLIEAEDVDLPSRTAKCVGCETIFRFELDDAPTVQVGGPAEPPVKPASIVEEDTGAQWRMTRHWRKSGMVFLLFFSAFWNAITWTIVVVVLTKEPLFTESGGINWETIGTMAFMSIFVLVGAATAYGGIASLFNRTVVTLDANELSVWKGPVPWFGGFTVPSPSIVKVDRKKDGEVNDDPRYGVKVHTLEGRSHTVSGFMPAEEADYVVWRLRERLGLR